MKAATYEELVSQALYEIDALMRIQLRSIPEDSDYPEMWALRGLAMRAIDLASVVMSAMAPDDAPKESIAALQYRLYGESDAPVSEHI